jgi:hypothetical protein
MHTKFIHDLAMPPSQLKKLVPGMAAHTLSQCHLNLCLSVQFMRHAVIVPHIIVARRSCHKEQHT